MGMRGSSHPAELDARLLRAAKSQSLLREAALPTRAVNGSRPPSMAEKLGPAREIDLACECIDETCTQRVTMTVGDYEAVRSNPNTFLVLPGHDVPELEEVVREEPNYVVVSKVGAGMPVAEKLDPRKRQQP